MREYGAPEIDTVLKARYEKYLSLGFLMRKSAAGIRVFWLGFAVQRGNAVLRHYEVD